MNTGTLLHNAYYGTGGFFDGSYLEKHKRERTENYEARKRIAYYYNFFAPIINALVDPVFKKQAFRDWTGGGADVVEAFVEDCDRCGSSLSVFMQRAALCCKLYGRCFIVVDNDVDVPNNIAGVLAERKMPYLYVVAPKDVDDVDFDRFGNVTKFSYKEQASNLKWRKITMTTEYIEITQDATIKTPHNLGRCPVIAMRSRSTGQNQPASEFISIVQIVLNLYNVCSWLSEIQKNQTFSILAYPRFVINDFEIGINNALPYDGEKTPAPSFIAPPAEPARVLMEQIALHIQEMYRLAGLSFATGTKAESSGVSKAWDFERTNQALSTLAAVCQNTEKQIMNLFYLWQGISGKYEVAYPKEFGIVDTQTEIENAQLIIDLGLSTGLKIELLKKVLSVYLPELPSERFDELVSEAESELNDVKYQDPIKGE